MTKWRHINLLRHTTQGDFRSYVRCGSSAGSDCPHCGRRYHIANREAVLAALGPDFPEWEAKRLIEYTPGSPCPYDPRFVAKLRKLAGLTAPVVHPAEEDHADPSAEADSPDEGDQEESQDSLEDQGEGENPEPESQGESENIGPSDESGQTTMPQAGEDPSRGDSAGEAAVPDAPAEAPPVPDSGDQPASEDTLDAADGDAPASGEAGEDPSRDQGESDSMEVPTHQDTGHD